jgi:hypothetical protein
MIFLVHGSMVLGGFADEVRSESFISTSCLNEFTGFPTAVPLANGLSGQIFPAAEAITKGVFTTLLIETAVLSDFSRHNVYDPTP